MEGLERAKTKEKILTYLNHFIYSNVIPFVHSY